MKKRISTSTPLLTCRPLGPLAFDQVPIWPETVPTCEPNR